ncbi:MAG: GGDEF domain-containing protein [Myxococcota bacterium]
MRAAFLDLVTAALRSADLGPALDVASTAELLAEQCLGVKSTEPLSLVFLQEHLERAGVDKRESDDVILFVHERGTRLGFPTTLPDDLSSLGVMTRANRVADFAAGYAFAQAVGRASERPPSANWADETPVISVLSLPKTDGGGRRASLLMMAGPRVGESYTLASNAAVIGRAADVEVSLDDHGLSRRHCEVIPHEGGFLLRDLGSKNGVLVNGTPVTERLLQEGDRIALGSNVLLKFVLQDEVEEQFQERLLESLTTDSTTGAYNRRFFVHRLRAECSYARRHAQDLALLFVDLDHFKGVNDTFGHPAGDHVLREVVKILKDGVRVEDVVSRYGGEELTVMLRGTPAEGAQLVAERLRVAIEQHRFEHHGVRVPVTVSIGVATLVTNLCDTPQDLVQAADEALYRAKHAGRNRTIVAPPGGYSLST